MQYALLSMNCFAGTTKLVTNLGDIRFADPLDGESIRQISIRRWWHTTGSHIARAAL